MICDLYLASKNRLPICLSCVTTIICRLTCLSPSRYCISICVKIIFVNSKDITLRLSGKIFLPFTHLIQYVDLILHKNIWVTSGADLNWTCLKRHSHLHWGRSKISVEIILITVVRLFLYFNQGVGWWKNWLKQFSI